MKPTALGCLIAAFVLLSSVISRSHAASISASGSPSREPLPTNPGGPVHLLPSSPVPVPKHAGSHQGTTAQSPGWLHYPYWCNNQLPFPYKTTNLRTSSHADYFEVCTDISVTSDTTYAASVDTIQFVLEEKCHDAVSYATFNGERLEMKVLAYHNPNVTGLIVRRSSSSSYPFVFTYEQLRQKPAQLCLYLSAPCLSLESFNNLITYYGVAPTNTLEMCALSFLYKPSGPSPSQSPYPSLPHAPTTAARPWPPGFVGARKLLQVCPIGQVNPQCSGSKVPLTCGKDIPTPGCDIAAISGTFPLPYPVGSCCFECKKTSQCNSWAVRGGVCYLKSPNFDATPPDQVLGCPPDVSLTAAMGSVSGGQSIVGSVCSC